MTEYLLRMPKVCDLVGYGRSSVYALVKAGKFPRPIRLVGGGAVAWRATEIQKWIEAQCKTPEAT